MHREVLRTPKMQFFGVFNGEVLACSPDLSNYLSITLVEYIDGKVSAAAVLRCSSLWDRDVCLPEIS